MLRIARNLQLTTRNYGKLATVEVLKDKINQNYVSQKYAAALEKFESKILFNSVLEVQKVRLRKLDQIIGKKERKRKKLEEKQGIVPEPLPLVLNQLFDNAVTLIETDRRELEIEYRRRYQKTVLPFSRFLRVEKVENLEENKELQNLKKQIPKNWLKDYELYDEAEEELESQYGSPDIYHPVTNVQCHGCGALLHCKDPSIPGYLPSEILKDLDQETLHGVKCQRCHFLKNYNVALSVSVKPEDYINIISSIKDDTAMMIIMVDLLDFPCSIFPNLSEIVGKTRPVFIVGNKVDLIPRDDSNYLNHIKDCLAKEALKMGFDRKAIRHIGLISAKTGYGIEELITKLQSIWRYKGNVYLIGCTNVGKSSLFNSLIKSDYCKSEASNLIQRATTCAWPGTTLKLLKFPILRPSDYRIHLRTQRLISDRQKMQPIEMMRRERAQKSDSVEDATLIGYIGRTFDEKEVTVDPAVQSQSSGFSTLMEVFDANQERYAQSKWCFDTPGVLHSDQVLPYLTADEIIKVLPRKMLRPRMFYVRSGMTLFIAGLARLDVINVPRLTRVIVYASLHLPISVCATNDADEFYQSFLGSEIFKVPMDMSEERLALWPKMEAAYEEIVIDGIDKNMTVCDFVMSSVGWIGINLPRDISGVFRPWILGKNGVGIRKPSLLPNGWVLRGRRVRDSPAYTIGKAYTLNKVPKHVKQMRQIREN